MYIYFVDASGILSRSIELPIVPGMGIQMPSDCVGLDVELSIAEPCYVWCWVDGKPVQIEDHRGSYYSIQDGSQVDYLELGPLPDSLTALARPSQFYVWVNSEWQLDAAAQTEALRVQVLQARDQKLRDAATRIEPLQDAVDLDDASAGEVALLKKWKQYRVALNRIQEQTSFPENTEWPATPV
ncbi:tail fiber assembly protein [Pseudomonas sp. NPDC087697]|uniref:tail fiber assembly protein n=1 Tax=Pseudomonas sp. NPDC087697 TaxID=3364447 RepID=UPI00381F4283